MKTNGLRNKKPAMARVAGRYTHFWSARTADAVDRWHIAAKGRK